MADQRQAEEVAAPNEGGDLNIIVSKWNYGFLFRGMLDCVKIILGPTESLSEMLSRRTATSYGVALTISILLNVLVVYADGIRGFSFLTWIIVMITSDSLRSSAFLALIVLLLITFT